ncbi:MAG: response regulator, partial [Paramuribaculum sp.]|nr:response regulator [Paramuribaculum sp.]
MKICLTLPKKQLYIYIYIYITVLILTLLSPFSAKAEYFRHLTLGDGLSQPSVMAISQDPLGRIWLGTREGINIYDGSRITSYKGWVPSGSDGEKIWIGNEVSAIVNDSNGNIFIHIDNDIVKYDILAGKFSHPYTHVNIQAIAENNGEIIFEAGDSLFVKKPEVDDAEFAMTLSDAGKLTHLSVDDTNFYASTGNGLHVFNRKTGKHSLLLPGVNVYSTLITKDGTLWITALNKGLYRYDKGGSTPRLVSVPYGSDRVMGASQCRHAVEDHNGNIWYGSFNGLFCYNPSTGDTRHIKIPMNIGGLTHSSVFGMYCDRKGNLWVGTYYGGVNYFYPENDKYLNFDYYGFGQENLSNSFVKDMVVDKDGNLWFAIDGAGVGCLDEHWNMTTHLFSGNIVNALRQNNVRSIEYDRDSNRLFIGTHLGGLSIYDIDRKTITNLIDNPAYQTIPGDVIHQLKLFNGKLFIASRTGLSWMDLKTGTIKAVNSNIKPLFFDLDKEGSIYCSSPTLHSLYKITDPTSDKPYVSKIYNADYKIIPSSLCTAERGILMTTLGNGLLYFPYDSEEVQHFNTNNSKIPDDYCYAVIPGTGSDIYLTTGANVVKLNLYDKTVQSVSFSDFFPESHIIFECALMRLDDDILVGSTKGITRLNRTDFDASGTTEMSPEIYFSKLIMQNKDIHPEDGSGIMEQALPYSNKIILPSDNNGFSIIIGVSDYLATTGTHSIEYRMDGMDSQWQTAVNNEVKYKNLPIGSYKLRARLTNGKEISLNVIVPAPWYRSWWAWMIYSAIVIAIAWFIIHKNLVAHKLNLSLKKEKTERAQIEKLNQERFVFFTNISHEFQTPLTLIISYVDNLISRYKRHPKLTENLLRVRTHSEQMSHLVTQLLEFRKLQQNQQVLRIGLHDAKEFLRETANPFCDYAERRNITFLIHTANSDVFGAFDPALLNRVLVNLLSNAFKYTSDNGTISCSVKKDSNGNIVFEVSDNGRGIAQKDLPFIFDRFYNGTADEQKNLSVDYHSTGIGLAFAKSIVDKHHGTISVESQEGKGSVFRVVIPGSLDTFTGDENVVFDKPSVLGVELSEDDSIIPISHSADTEDIAEIGLNGDNDSDKPLLLIVEDNDELRKNLVEFFSSYFRIAEADNGEDGLSKTRELSPDIIISDVMMPKMSGTEMCKTIKADIDLCHIPVILLTALSASESKLEGLNTNADDYVTKPFESTLLLARVDNLLRLRRILRKQFEKQPIAEVDMSIVNPMDRELLKRTTEAIEKHIEDLEFDIPALCREVGVSRSLF